MVVVLHIVAGAATIGVMITVPNASYSACLMNLIESQLIACSLSFSHHVHRNKPIQSIGLNSNNIAAGNVSGWPAKGLFKILFSCVPKRH